MSVDIDVLKSKNPPHCFPDGSPKDYAEKMGKCAACKEKSELFKDGLCSWCHELAQERKDKDQRAREAGH